MTPVTPGTVESWRTSSRELTPPEARTGMPAARATASVLVRRSSLEDVFLTLTGRTLEE